LPVHYCLAISLLNFSNLNIDRLPQALFLCVKQMTTTSRCAYGLVLINRTPNLRCFAYNTFNTCKRNEKISVFWSRRFNKNRSCEFIFQSSMSREKKKKLNYFFVYSRAFLVFKRNLRFYFIIPLSCNLRHFFNKP